MGLFFVSPAWAQFGPSPQPGGTGPEPQKEGVAEQAPVDDTVLPPTPQVAPPVFSKTRHKIVTMDGLFRFRGDWLKNLHLGFDDDPDVGGAPFPRSLGCQSTVAGVPCKGSIKSSNMRLRLEPTFYVTENTSVHMQLDVLDNVILGSTPESAAFGRARPGYLSLGVFSDNQTSPEITNSLNDSIRVKRAWAEIHTALGKIKVGRQPSHWGLGILANSGAYDPIHDTYDIDGDYGDTVDRLEFSTTVPGTDFTASIALDWPSTAPTSAQDGTVVNRLGGQPWDLDDNDDINQWVFSLARIDDPRVFNDKVADGGWAVNYGAYLIKRTQDYDYDTSATNVGDPVDIDAFVSRDATVYVPDLWLRLAKGGFSFELETAFVLGNINDVADLGLSRSLDIRQFGGVAKTQYAMANDKVRFGLEFGFASGDQWDNEPAGATHVANARPFPGAGDTTISAFRFDFDYKIDLILFRELLGTITNASYIKPSLTWDISSAFRFNLASIISFANVPVSTPGNGSMYGIEFDGDLGYHKKGFFAGISYGLFFPLAAMDHPADVTGQGGPGFGFDTNSGSAGTAQTIQTRLLVQF